jgi:hypothetical protein
MSVTKIIDPNDCEGAMLSLNQLMRVLQELDPVSFEDRASSCVQAVISENRRYMLRLLSRLKKANSLSSSSTLIALKLIIEPSLRAMAVVYFSRFMLLCADSIFYSLHFFALPIK